MRGCTCCGLAIEPENVRPFVMEGLYQLYFECAHCHGTGAVTLYEEPLEDDVLVADELRDLRPTEAA